MTLISTDELVHYGVKGMKWGVRKDDETGEGRSRSLTERFRKAHKPKEPATTKEAADNLLKNEEKSRAKLVEGGKKEPGKVRKYISDNKATIATAAVYGGIFAGLVLAEHISRKKIERSIKNSAGKPIDADKFLKHVEHSKYETWAKDDFMTRQAFDRKEFSLPAGHTFHRISLSDETSFRGATYSTHSREDYNRYLTQFQDEKGLIVGSDAKSEDFRHVTFQSKEEIKVPNLGTVLEVFKGVLSGKDASSIVEDSDVLKVYQELSGGSWDDDRAKGLFGALRGKGYGAIVDEMDAGVRGDSPLVVFAHDLMTDKKSSILTDDEFDEARSNLIELQDRKY